MAFSRHRPMEVPRGAQRLVWPQLVPGEAGHPIDGYMNSPIDGHNQIQGPPSPRGSHFASRGRSGAELGPGRSFALFSG